MGRPLTGSVRRNANGTVTVELPLVLGGKRAAGVRFPNFEQAENWRVAAVAALVGGRPRPNPEPFQRSQETADETTNSGAFADVALAWWEERYNGNAEVSVNRAEDVLGIINRRLIPFFGARVSHIRDLKRRDGIAYVQMMAGVGFPASTMEKYPRADEQILTKLQAAQWSGASKSRVNRAWLAGRFPNARLDRSASVGGVVRIPVKDLLAAGFRPKDVEVTASPLAYAKSVTRGDLAILHNIVGYAQSLRLMDFDPFKEVKSRQPADGSKTHTRRQAKLKPLHLDVSKNLAANMDVHNQLTFWLCRCLGLRIAEAFGIHLDDVYRVDGRYLIQLQRQGGKWWKVRDPESGEVTKVSEIDRMKTDASARVLPIPSQLAEFIETYIEAFHVDSSPSTPLIVATSGAGASRFSSGLRNALQLIGLSFDDIGYSASPHFWRKCFITDMKDRTSERPRSIYSGHRVAAGTGGGAAMTDRVYTLEQGEVQDLVPVAVAMEKLISETIGTLVTPRPAAVVLGRPSRYHRATDEVAYKALDSAGFFSAHLVGGDEVVDFVEASSLLGIPVSSVATLVRQGRIQSRFLPRTTHRNRNGILLSSITEYLDFQTSEAATADAMWTRRELCDALKIDYMTLHFLMARLGISPSATGHPYAHLYDEASVSRIRAELALIHELTQRCVTASEAAKMLGLNLATIMREIKSGRLSVDDAATAVRRMTMLTRDSVDRLANTRAEAKKVARANWSPPPGSIPIADAQQLSGLKRMQLLPLAREGVIFYKGPDYSFHVDRASLENYIRGTSPATGRMD